MKNTILLLAGLISASLMIQSCDKSEEVTTPQTNTCDQFCKDVRTAYAMAEIWRITLNNNIGIRFTGYHDTVVAGPSGGTIHITGNFTKYSSDSAYHDFTFSMSGCKIDGSNYTMTFDDGDMGITGTYTNSSGYRSLVFLGYNMKFFGNITYGENQSVPVFEQSCTINFAELTDNRYGNICGRDFNNR